MPIRWSLLGCEGTSFAELLHPQFWGERERSRCFGAKVLAAIGNSFVYLKTKSELSLDQYKLQGITDTLKYLAIALLLSLPQLFFSVAPLNVWNTDSSCSAFRQEPDNACTSSVAVGAAVSGRIPVQPCQPLKATHARRRRAIAKISLPPFAFVPSPHWELSLFKPKIL